MTDDYKKYSNYYVEKHIKTNVIFYANHNYIMEKNLWKTLHDKNILKLFLRTKSPEGTKKPNQSWRTQNFSYKIKDWVNLAFLKNTKHQIIYQ